MRATFPSSLAALVAVSLLAGCGYERPVEKNDGWRTGPASSFGVSEYWLAAMSALAERPETGIHSVLVVKDGVLVFEGYYNGWDPEEPHALFSVSKSVTSMLVGIAVEAGSLPGIHVPAARYFPAVRGPGWTADKDGIELAHLLSNTSGLRWEEWEIPYTDPGNSHYRMTHADDWTGFVLNEPLTGNPGHGFEYNTGGFFVLGQVLKQAVGTSADRYSERVLLEPLGIEEHAWARNERDKVCAGGSYGGLRLKSRDLARVGVMVLDDGRWQGRQVVPAEWLEESTTRRAGLDPYVGYGYGWWVYDLPGFGRRVRFTAGMGYGGQALLVFPDHDAVVVLTSDHRDPDMKRLIPCMACLMTAILGPDAIPAGAQLTSSMGG